MLNRKNCIFVFLVVISIFFLPASTYKYGKRHSSWSEKDARGFLISLDAAMKTGGKGLQKDGWKGTWHSGSRSFSALDGVKLKYFTKAKFSHSVLSKGKSDIIQVYIWKFHTQKESLNKGNALINYYKNINRKSVKGTTYTFLNHLNLGLGYNSHLLSIKILYSRYTRSQYIAFFSSGKWFIYITGTLRQEPVTAALAALYRGFSK